MRESELMSFYHQKGLRKVGLMKHKSVYFRDGILVIVKNAIVPAGTKIGEE